MRSPAALAATFVLAVVWSSYERTLAGTAHWEFLPLWSATVVAAAWLGWRPGLHLAAISLVVWLIPLGFFLLDHHAHWSERFGGGTAWDWLDEPVHPNAAGHRAMAELTARTLGLDG